jgi:uncharacterized protein (DUF488 family)
MSAPRLLTVGHSTHPFERFTALLSQRGVEVLADVRRFPGSRRMPQFNAGALTRSLPAAGVEYARLGDELGGMRAEGGGGRAAALAAYAEHMRSAEFAAGLERLEAIAGERRTAVMCAEGGWRRCHRSLLADAMVARGWEVLHIAPGGGLEEHVLAGRAPGGEQESLLQPPP